MQSKPVFNWWSIS